MDAFNLSYCVIKYFPSIWSKNIIRQSLCSSWGSLIGFDTRLSLQSVRIMIKLNTLFDCFAYKQQALTDHLIKAIILTFKY